MSIIAASTSHRPARRGRAARPPYAVGDHARTLYNDPQHGTSLALAAPVTLVERDETNSAYPWRVVVEATPGVRVERRVNARGVDAAQYIEPSVSTMTHWHVCDPAAAFAVELAAQLRRAGCVGPLARRTEHALHVVEVSWPSGRTRVRVVVEAHNGVGTFTCRTYPDVEDAEPVTEREAYTVPHALGVLLPALL